MELAAPNPPAEVMNAQPADHRLHYTPGSEGYGHWRLECLPEGFHKSYVERREAWPNHETCHCTKAGNDCEYCREGDHGGCGFYGENIDELGYSCRLDIDEKNCWTTSWFDNLGAGCLWGDDWHEDGPWLCHAGYDGALTLTYASPAAVNPAEPERLRQWKAEAMTVLAEWEKVWEAAGKPGKLGSSKAAAVRELLINQTTSRTDEQVTLNHAVREMLADRRPMMAPMWRSRLTEALAAVDRLAVSDPKEATS